MRKVKLSSYCAVKNGYAFKSNDYVSSGYRVMRITNVQKGTIADYDPKFISNKIADDKSNFKLKAGDILVSLTGNVGRVGRIQEIHLPAVLNQRVGLIRPLSREIDDEFIFQYLNSDYFEAEAIKNANGVAQLNLSSKWLENHLIPFLPLNDQIRIAHLLGKVEGLIANRKQHLQQFDELLKSVFLEMFGDPVRNKKGWDKFCIDQIVENARNGLSPAKGGKFKGNVYTLSSVTGDEFREIYKEDHFSKLGNNYIPSMRDFLVCRGNGNINLVGKGHFYPGLREDVMFPDTIIALTIKDSAINKRFLEVLWNTNFIRAQLEKAARTANGTYKINQQTLLQIKIISPPQKVQCDFERIANMLRKLADKVEQSLTDLEALYGALSQKAFKGELDLSRVPLPIIEPEEEQAVLGQAIPDAPEKECAFELPDIDHLPTALDNTEARKAVLRQWLKAYCDQLGSAPFSLQHWMGAVQTRLTDTLRMVIEDETLSEEDKARLNERYPNEEVKLDANDYDDIKDWVFKALKEGTLTQALDDTGHCVQLEPEAVLV